MGLPRVTVSLRRGVGVRLLFTSLSVMGVWGVPISGTVTVPDSGHGGGCRYRARWAPLLCGLSTGLAPGFVALAYVAQLVWQV